jgi:hypothetical protein
MSRFVARGLSGRFWAKDLEWPPSVAIVEVLSLNGKLAETPGSL